MEISSLTLKLIVLLIPGAIASKIIQTITVSKPLSEFQFVVNSIIFGVVSYILLQLSGNLWAFISCFYTDRVFFFDARSLEVWSKLSEGGYIPYKEVFGASIMSIGVGVTCGLADNRKWINSYAQKWGISNKYGDENLYSYFLNARETQIVYIRYIQKGLTYHGRVQSYSETENFKEIVLYEVTVYTYPESDKLYDVDQLYLSLPKEDVIIETANMLSNEQEQGNAE